MSVEKERWNVGIKISAFLMALVIWFYFFAAREGISFAKGSTKTIMIPVKALQSPSSMVDVWIFPDSVNVTVRGTRETVAELGTEDLKVFVDVKGLSRGLYTLPVRIYSVSPVKVISKEPQTVRAAIKERHILKSLEQAPGTKSSGQDIEKEGFESR